MFFEPFLTLIKQGMWGKETGENFIFTDDEAFNNAADYYHTKDNAVELFICLKVCYTYKMKIAGVYIPFLPNFRNIINVID